MLQVEAAEAGEAEVQRLPAGGEGGGGCHFGPSVSGFDWDGGDGRAVLSVGHQEHAVALAPEAEGDLPCSGKIKILIADHGVK